jgi:hypothetical protein
MLLWLEGALALCIMRLMSALCTMPAGVFRMLLCAATCSKQHILCCLYGCACTAWSFVTTGVMWGVAASKTCQPTHMYDLRTLLNAPTGAARAVAAAGGPAVCGQCC